jgi:hypothetical protein
MKITSKNVIIKGSANKCRDHKMVVKRGKGPHAYKLWCSVCNKNRGWLSRRDAIRLAYMNDNKND